MRPSALARSLALARPTHISAPHARMHEFNLRHPAPSNPWGLTMAELVCLLKMADGASAEEWTAAKGWGKNSAYYAARSIREKMGASTTYAALVTFDRWWQRQEPKPEVRE